MKKVKMNVLARQQNSKELLKFFPKKGKHFKEYIPQGCEKIVLDEGYLLLKRLDCDEIDDEY